ncbi:MAG: adenylyltransferase/cytidyltransferase family protein, partial [Clostridia bacterium]|nr:adenylyltransferase/cytidyltransferase family protein [Clostridia bacterium]
MNSKLALVTGSFDPVTVGHRDIISRAAKMFDRVIVLVANNEDKEYMFTAEERVAIARAAVCDLENVTVEGFDGYVAD